MKLKLLIINLLAVSLFAIDNINDIKPHSYGVQNLTIDLLPGTYNEKIKGKSTVDPMNKFGLIIHSKASLKEFYYKKAEIFWGGSGGYSYLRDKFDNDIQNLDIETNIGLSTNFLNLIYAVDMGVHGKWITTTGKTTADSFDLTTKEDSNTIGKIYFYGEGAIAKDFGGFAIASIYRISTYNENAQLNFRNKISLQYQSNVDRSTAFNITPSYQYDRNKKESIYQVLIGFSWLYR